MPLPRGRKFDQGQTHRLPPGAVEAMLARQGGRCLICGDEIGPGRFVVDHDHELARRHGHSELHGCPRCVRGLLCSARCNALLGFARDDPRVLRRAADYVEQARAAHR